MSDGVGELGQPRPWAIAAEDHRPSGDGEPGPENAPPMRGTPDLRRGR